MQTARHHSPMMCQGEIRACSCQLMSADFKWAFEKAILVRGGLPGCVLSDLPVNAEWVSTWADSPTPGSYSFTVS